MPGALDGIRIIDTTAMFSGPLATMTLADQGAEVIKIEPPDPGDLMRKMGLQRGGIAATFHTVNRNKRSVVLNLREPEGQALAVELVKTADVFVQNFRPGVAARLGLGEPALRAANEGLIYVSMSAWGETGPLAQRPAFDSIVQAVAGFASSQAGEDGVPELIHNSITDKITGLTAAQAITAALFARERGAGGQHVKLAMLDVAVAFLWIDVMQHRVFAGNESAGRNSWPRVLPTTDGHVITSLINDRQFAGATRALDAAALADDPRFAKVEARLTHLSELSEALSAISARFSTAGLCERLEAEDVPHAPITTLEELERLEQVQLNETLFLGEHPESGSLRLSSPVARFEATPSSVRSLAPALGAQTDEVLGELGLTAERIAALRERGAVA